MFYKSQQVPFESNVQGRLSHSAKNCIENAMARLLQTKGVHNAVLGVASGRGHFCWTGAGGLANGAGRPMDLATLVYSQCNKALYWNGYNAVARRRGRSFGR
jgi:hypothetical protein